MYNGAHVDVVIRGRDGRDLTVRDYAAAEAPSAGTSVCIELIGEAVLTDTSPDDPEEVGTE
jgi:hypothetical protein